MTLKVHSRLIAAHELGLNEDYSFADLLGTNTSAFIYEKQGLIGWGEALRLETTGPNRILELDSKWRDVASQAEISDEVNLSGSGLISFGSIAFSENSKSTSVLVIPQVVVGKRDGALWLTTINISEADKLVGMLQIKKNIDWTLPTAHVHWFTAYNCR